MRTQPRFPLSSRTPPDNSNTLEATALAVVVAVVLLATLLWLAGEIAGRLFGGAWVHISATEMGGVVLGIEKHPGDPAAAWPLRVRAVLPGPVAFYATLVMVVVPVSAAAVVVFLRREPLSGSRSGAAASRWARRRDLRALTVRRTEPGRLTLGRAGGRLLAAEQRQSVLVVGPTQTLKTTGFAVPAILEWQGPVLATSIKSDLLRDTLHRRSTLGRVFVYDPTGSTGLPSAGWTPLPACRSWQGAQRTASWLVGSAQHTNGSPDSGTFWYAATAKLLAPLLHAAGLAGLMMADVVRWIDTQEEEEVRDVLEKLAEPEPLTAAEASWLRDPKTRSGIYTTAETVLAAYADPGVLASAERDELSPEHLLDGGPNTAYICAPAHEQRRLQPLLSTLVQEMLAAVFERATVTGRPLDPPLLLVLDEAANIAPLRDLDMLAATSAAQGIQLVSVFQDVAQIHAVYGRDRAATIVSNHRAKVVLSGISDPETLELVGRLLGDEEVRQLSATRGSEGQHSHTESVGYRRLAPANLLRQMRAGEGLLVYGHLPPARLSLRPWFRDRRLRGLAEAGEPS